MLPLTVQCIGGDQDAPQLGQGVQGGGERGDLVTVDHAGLGEHQLVRVVVDADQLGLAALAAAGAAQRLAVYGQHLAALCHRAAAAASRRDSTQPVTAASSAAP